MKSTLRTVLYFLAAVLISASIAVTLTVTIMRKQSESHVTLGAEEYKELSELKVFDEMMEKIESEALNCTVTDEQLLSGAAKGMLDVLNDDYAAYYTAAEYEEYLARINGEYNGVGLLVSQPDEQGAIVLDVYDETPAALSGIQTGDIITAVDGQSVSGILLEELASMINKEIGAEVKFTLLRGAQQLEIAVVSGSINIKRVEYALFKERTGYIRIDMFTGNCVAEFDEAYKDLTERGLRSLVIDLRNNPGGSLSDVVDIAETLLGDCVIVSVRGGDDETGTVYRSGGKGIKIPLAIIVNANSASASEILAAAVQDNEVGVVVGMTTFGKGVVQTTMPLTSNGGWLKLTTDAYYTPNNNNINGVGITPDIEIDLPDDMGGISIGELEQEDDAQLWAALDYVRELANEQD